MSDSIINSGKSISSDQSGASTGSNASDNESSRGSAQSQWELGNFRNFLDGQLSGITRRFNGKLESSDLVQQTLVEAYQKLDQFRGRSSGELAKWLSQILANNTVDAARGLQRQKRDINRECPLDRADQGSIGGEAEWLAAEQTSPSLAFQHAEQLLELSQAIGELPEAQQEVIVLHHLQGLSMNEVAKRVNRSRPSVAGLAYRALKTLRQTMSTDDR